MSVKYQLLLAACGALATCYWLSSRSANVPATKSAAQSTLSAVTAAAPSADTPPHSALPAPRAPALLDEPALMAELRQADGRDPELCLVLARDGNARFPNSPDAAERAALAVKSLALSGRLSEARGEAELMVNHYRPSRWTEEVERHTGAHPHRAVARLP